MNLLLSDIHSMTSGKLIGNPDTCIRGFSGIDDIEPDSLIFIDSEQYSDQAIQSLAAAVIVPPTIQALGDKALIQVDRPMLTFMLLLKHFFQDEKYPGQIHPSAVIAADTVVHITAYVGPNVVIGDGCNIGPNAVILAGCVLGNNVSLGESSRLHPNVVVYDNSVIGKNTVIHAGSVIGSDGFGYRLYEGVQHKVPHVGKVVIEDNVEIGANTVVDRASLGVTRIGEGTKIDNLVQIAHSVKIGRHNLICSMTGVAGSSKTGNYVTLAANVGVSDHVVIEDNVVLGARAGVAPKKLLRKDTVWLGNPARPQEKAIAQVVAQQQLPELIKKVRELQKRVKELEAGKD
jgi:UDP-3-O-[3-hydroxymyristoyl] glucosamine N-acyltransferase